MIGSDKDGNPVETVFSQIAIKSGKSTGLVSDTRLTHATPAAFAADQPHRDPRKRDRGSNAGHPGPDVMLSGGLRPTSSPRRPTTRRRMFTMRFRSL